METIEKIVLLMTTGWTVILNYLNTMLLYVGIDVSRMSFAERIGWVVAVSLILYLAWSRWVNSKSYRLRQTKREARERVREITEDILISSLRDAVNSGKLTEDQAKATMDLVFNKSRIRAINKRWKAYAKKAQEGLTRAFLAKKARKKDAIMPTKIPGAETFTEVKPRNRLDAILRRQNAA